MLDAALGTFKSISNPIKSGAGKRTEAYILPHGLCLLVADDGEFGNLRCLLPPGLGQKGWGHPLTKAYRWLCSPTHPSPVPPLTLLPTSFFPFVALVMPSSRDTPLELSMTLMCLSGAKNLRDSLFSQLCNHCNHCSDYATTVATR